MVGEVLVNEYLSHMRRRLARTPPAVIAALAIVFFILGSLAIVPFLPPLKDVHAECRKQCAPRASQVVPDKDYPMSAKGMYRDKCECY